MFFYGTNLSVMTPITSLKQVQHAVAALFFVSYSNLYLLNMLSSRYVCFVLYSLFFMLILKWI